ncbi:MAG: YcxB family protein [Bacilli bacterium]|nr:YcxB family protein [Bacilli bacterium]MBN2877709.1 YcxB family protein [Bacilli bacterium]
MEPLKLTYPITESDFTKVNIWAALEKTPFMALVNRYLLLGIDVAILIIAIIAELPIGYFFLLIIVGLTPLLMRLSLMLRASKKYRKNSLLQEHDITLVFQEDGLSEQFAGLHYETAWDEIKIVTEYKDLLIIELNTQRVLFAPYLNLEEEQKNQLKAIIEQHLKQEQIKFRKPKQSKESETKDETN